MELLVCLDFSETAQRVFDVGTDLALRLGANLVLLHVAAPEPDFVGYDVGPQTIRDDRKQALRREQQELETWCEAARSKGLSVRTVMVEGTTHTAILEHAAAAQWIVMGSHGRSALMDMLVGSTTQAVLRHSPVPVLVVPPRLART